jgi:hydroxymethylglutaryl-CoA reductase
MWEKKMESDDSLIKKALCGFSKLSGLEKVNCLIRLGLLTAQDISELNSKKSSTLKIGNTLIENYIGNFNIPLGIAVNFFINGKHLVIPMAIEETSVIASLSKTAKWIRDEGQLTSVTKSWLGIGQIQIPKVKNKRKLDQFITENKNSILAMLNEQVASSMCLRGGGAKDLQLRYLAREDGYDMGVIHVLVDTCDAMGANTINQICEFLKAYIENMLLEKVGLAILSNLAETKITHAQVIIRKINPELGEAIEEASYFAQIDPYRAATNNKGIMNAVDAILIATGNDWRAVEAGVHAYAAKSGQYRSLSTWKMRNGALHGDMEVPIDLGIIGGVTRLHPIAQICLNILKIDSAQELAQIVAAAGLVQNLAALTSLVTDGIIKGHMKLHINNLLLPYKLNQMQLRKAQQELIDTLRKNKRILGSDIKKIINQIRNKD